MASGKTASRRMTEGNILKHLVAFGLPLMVGNIFQQLYNTVDSVIVGNFVSKTALAAVGSTDTMINTLLGLFIGIATGAGVVISQSFGRKDDEELSRAVHTTMAVTLLGCVIVTFLGIWLSPFLVRIMKTPEDVVPESEEYLRIYFIGVSGVMLYNTGASILRAVGDSKRPLYILIFCAVTNIVLDLLFVVGFHAGVGGAAWATIISQWLSMFLVMGILLKEKESYRIVFKKLRIDGKLAKEIFRIGVPSGLQMAVTSFSNVFVQSYINSFGSSCMAGWTTYGKLDKFWLMPIQSMGLSATTFVGQNLGAGKSDRARRGTTIALYSTLAVAFVIIIPVIGAAPVLVRLFTTDAETQSYGVKFLRMMMPFYVGVCFNQIYANALRGAGDSVSPMIVMMGSFIVFRQIYLFIISKFVNTVTWIALGYPFGWILCSALLFISYKRSDWSSFEKKESTEEAISPARD